MIDLVVSKVEGKEFVVGKEEFSYHHCTVGLDFVLVEVQVLQVSALLQGFGQILSTFRLNLVALKVQTEQSWTSGYKVSKSLSTFICNFVVTQIDVFNVNCKLL